jgi:hypothetical protein
METWDLRVANYLDQLEELVFETDQILHAASVNPVRRDPTTAAGSMETLSDKLELLEQRVADREELLRAADAPPTGATLTEKLLASKHFQLAARADQIAEQISLAHQRSMSLFVCQFHLANLTADLVRILTGADYPATYGGRDRVQSTPQGGLFNKSA